MQIETLIYISCSPYRVSGNMSINEICCYILFVQKGIPNIFTNILNCHSQMTCILCQSILSPNFILIDKKILRLQNENVGTYPGSYSSTFR